MTDPTASSGDSRPSTPGWVDRELGGATGRGVRIAVLDSGWNRDMNDSRIERGRGFADHHSPPRLRESSDDHDRIGHGTACTELILRVAPNATIVPLRVFGQYLETSVELLLAAIDWASRQSIPLINMSLGTIDGKYARPLYQACQRALERGSIAVAAGHGSAMSLPASFDCVIGVMPGRFGSPFEYRYVADNRLECEALGYGQSVRRPSGELSPVGGASFAAPNITGIVALILERCPSADLPTVRRLLASFSHDDDRFPVRGGFER